METERLIWTAGPWTHRLDPIEKGQFRWTVEGRFPDPKDPAKETVSRFDYGTVPPGVYVEVERLLHDAVARWGEALRVKVERPREGWWHADECHIGRVFRVLGEEICGGLHCYRVRCPESFGPEARIPIADCSIERFSAKPAKTT